MGMELEFKLAVSSPALLEKILFDPQIAEVRKENYRLIHMATIYYDTPDSRLQTRRWTLRLRQENARLVATLKTPAAGKARGEWECEAASIQAAIPMLLEQILFDKDVAQVRQGDYRLLEMATVYYDTTDRTLSQRRWTLRLRQENQDLVATLKTPGQGRARNEWECQARDIREALPLLVEAGAPAELAALTAQGVVPLCVARFTRRAADLVFADGTVCELAGDVGQLGGGGKEEALCEVEIELKSGDAGVAEAFARELQARFGLREESRSKFARAAALAKE